MGKDYMEIDVVKQISKAKEVGWINPEKIPWKDAEKKLEMTIEDINDAQERLERFAPFIMKCFPETIDTKGIIESALTPIPKMQEYLEETYNVKIGGRLLLKQDSHLAVAGSVKARGGIYEVLKHTEDLALDAGLITLEDDYSRLADEECRKFFEKYTIQVGSTGNLGLSIGITSAAIGYQVIVHMSADAKQWKKDMLKSHGVKVIEYESDYSEAVKQGRKESDDNPRSYFVDDENSKNLFLGYAVAARRLKAQMDEQGICVDEEHPLFVYIPCGVGGAPGGVTFGLKEIWGDYVHVFFVEPTQAPCMILGMATGLHNEICVQDVGLTGLTHADGLAVGRPSGFVGKVMEPLLSGEFTVEDKWLYEYMRALWDTEKIFIEPSSCAAFEGPLKLSEYTETKKYLEKENLSDKIESAVHVVWATGGSLVPEEIRQEYKNTFL
ncbi:MAG: D-serine ammonia-lyase [Lachnospiraceae bacterium]